MAMPFIGENKLFGRLRNWNSMKPSQICRDELEFLERVFLLATITIETDSIKIKMLRSILFL